MNIDQTTIVGGTHGNEYTGIYLVNQYEAQPAEVTHGSFATRLLIANPRAFEKNVRFIDADLNRSFALRDLHDTGLAAYEANRAKVLNPILGPKESPGASDFLIDLHTSTSNCGLALFLVNPIPFNFRVAAYVQTKIPDTRIYHLEISEADEPFVIFTCERALAVEVGPVPQGVIRHDVLELSRLAVGHILDALDLLNRGAVIRLPDSIEYYRHRGSISYPTRGDLITAYVHETLQDADFQPLKPGDPLFRTFAGEEILYDGSETIYPALIDERRLLSTEGGLLFHLEGNHASGGLALGRSAA